MKKILGLDLSLTSTGWHYGTGLPYGAIEPKLKSPITPNDQNRRLGWIRDTLNETVLQHGIPDLIVMEGYGYGSMTGNAQAELGGVIRLFLYEHHFHVGDNVIIVAPTSLKKFATGKGNAEKETMRAYALKHYGFDDLEVKDDVVDAFFLAQIGYVLTGQMEVRNQIQQEVITLLTEPKTKPKKKAAAK